MGLTPSRWSIRIYRVLSDLTSCAILGKPLNLFGFSCFTRAKRGMDWLTSRAPFGCKIIWFCDWTFPWEEDEFGRCLRMDCSDSPEWGMCSPQHYPLLLPSNCFLALADIYVCVYVVCLWHTYCAHIEGRRQLAEVGSLSAWVPGIGLGSSDLVTVAFTHEASPFPSHWFPSMFQMLAAIQGLEPWLLSTPWLCSVHI